MMNEIKLDIVIVGLDEGELLRQAIESCLKETAVFSSLGHPKPSIIYVDSHSTDGSIELARSLGVESYLVEGVPSASAGRHTGFKHCHGDYVFFMDGDMELYPGWLQKAVEYLETHPDAAGVGGVCDWKVAHGDGTIWLPNHNGIVKDVEKVTSDVGGAFVYRNSVLRSVGDFDPTVVRGEEFELYLRVRAGGYEVFSLKIPMCVHHDYKGNLGWKRFIGYNFFTSRVLITGAVERIAPSCKDVKSLGLKRYWLFFLHPLLVIALISLFHPAVIGLLGDAWAATLVVVTLILISLHYKYKNRVFIRAMVSMITMNIYVPAFIIGYIFKIPNVGGFYQAKTIFIENNLITK